MAVGVAHVSAELAKTLCALRADGHEPRRRATYGIAIIIGIPEAEPLNLKPEIWIRSGMDVVAMAANGNG